MTIFISSVAAARLPWLLVQQKKKLLYSLRVAKLHAESFILRYFLFVGDDIYIEIKFE